jgi:hypothetical protein
VADYVELIIQLPRGSSVDTHLRESPPASVTSGRAVLEHLSAGRDGRLEPPLAGEIVLSVLSPEALAREPDEVRRAIEGAELAGEPLVVLVEAAEELRDEELDAVLDATSHTGRTVILRIAEGA